MKKRTAYSYGEASYAQRFVREGRKGHVGVASRREVIKVLESFCVSRN